MSKNLTQKASLNAIAQFIDYGARIVVTLVLTPILVTGLGTSSFGVWQILRKSSGILSVADGRPSQSLKWIIANLQGKKDRNKKQRSVGSAIIVWGFFLPILTLLGVVFVWASPLITGVSPNEVLVVKFTAALLVVKILLLGLVGIPEAILRGSNLGYKRMGIVALITCLEGGGMAYVVLIGGGMTWLAGLQVTMSILTGILFFQVTRHSVNWFGCARPSKQEVKKFFKFNGWFLGWSIISRLLDSIDIILIGIILSATYVTQYTLTGYGPLMAFGVILILTGSVMPGLGGLIGLKEYGRVDKLRKELTTYTWLLTTTCASVILLLNPSFVNLWVGEQQYAGQEVNLLLVVLLFQKIFIQNNARIIDLTLDLRAKVLMGSIALLLSITASTILLYQYGMIGVCIGMILGQLTLSIAYSITINNLLKVSYANNVVENAKTILFATTIVISSSYFGEKITIESYMGFIITLICSTITTFTISIFLLVSATERDIIYKRINSIRLKPN